MAHSKNKIAKRYIKFLEICSDSRTIKQLLLTCPDKVIKILCNAALNIYCGDIALSKSQKRIFGQYRKLFLKIGNIKIPLAKKRQLFIRLSKTNILSNIIITLNTIFGDKIYI